MVVAAFLVGTFFGAILTALVLATIASQFKE